MLRTTMTGEIHRATSPRADTTVEARTSTPRLVPVDARNRFVDLGGDPAAVPPDPSPDRSSDRQPALVRGDLVAGTAG